MTPLQQFEHDLSLRFGPEVALEREPRLLLRESHGLLDADFFADPAEDEFSGFLRVLTQPEAASHLRSLSFHGPDEGANGTRNWDFSPLLETATPFPELRSFSIEPTSPEHHNASILGAVYDEDGMLAGLLDRMPRLEALTSPSAPDERFFQVGPRPLTYLRVETGYDHQSFIRNLSRSSCFPELRLLDFGDFNDRTLENYQQHTTPYEEYEALFRSQAFAGVGLCIVRNPALSVEQLRVLNSLRSNLSLRVVHSWGEYA